MSTPLEKALSLCREGMSDVQKSYIIQKEAKILHESGNIQSCISVITYAINLNHVVPFFSLRALCYKSLHKWTEAYFDYCFAIQIEPEVGSHFSLRGLCLAKLKKIDLAIEDLTQAIDLEPISSHFITRATLYSESRMYDKAIKDLDKAIALSVEEDLEMKILALFRRAQVYHEISRYTEAIEDLKYILNKDVNSLPPRILLARSYKMSGDLYNAEEEINYAILIHANDYAVYYERGDIRYRYQQSSKSIQAVEDFNKCIKLLKDKEKILQLNEKDRENGISRKVVNKLDTQSVDTSVSGGLSGTQSEIDAEAKVKVAFEKQVDLHELEDIVAETHCRRAQALLTLEYKAQEDLMVAKNDAELAVKLIPDNEEFKLVLATCYIRLEELQEAHQIIEMVLKLNPNNEKALFHEAFCFRLDGKYKEAIENLTKIIATRERKLRLLNGKISEFSNFKSTLEIPDEKYSIPLCIIFEMRANLLYEGKSYKLALHDFGRSILLSPSKPENYFLRADCHTKLGNYTQALQDLTLAEEIGYSDIFSLLICRGTILRTLSMYAEAEVELRKALTLIEVYNKPKSLSLSPNIPGMNEEMTSPKAEDSPLHSFNESPLHSPTNQTQTKNNPSNNNNTKIDDHIKIRALSLHSLTLMQISKPTEALKTLQISRKIIHKNNTVLEKCIKSSPKKSTKLTGLDINPKLARDRFNTKNLQREELSGRSNLSITTRNKLYKSSTYELNQISLEESNLESNKKLLWTISFHMAKCLHNLRRYEDASKCLEICLKKLSRFAPDDFAVGAALFFYGIIILIILLLFFFSSFQF